jgi:tetratricopeptide (TPR) repeat protein
MLCVCEPARYTVIDLFLPKFSCSRWHQTCSVFLLPRQAQDRNLYIMLALEAAIAAEPQFIPARIALALIDDHADRESAIAQYRASLTDRPNDPRTLNNLAYALAVYRNNPEEALPIAQRATVVALEDPALLGGAIISNYYSLGTYRREPLLPYSLDTLACVLHLLGRHVKRRTRFEKRWRRRRLCTRSPVACGDHLRCRRPYASGVS